MANINPRFQYYQDAKSFEWWWRFVDMYGDIKAVSHHGFATDEVCLQDIKALVNLIRGISSAGLEKIPDPNK